jgi:hypothetical protein
MAPKHATRRAVAFLTSWCGRLACIGVAGLALLVAYELVVMPDVELGFGYGYVDVE